MKTGRFSSFPVGELHTFSLFEDEYLGAKQSLEDDKGHTVDEFPPSRLCRDLRQAEVPPKRSRGGGGGKSAHQPPA